MALVNGSLTLTSYLDLTKKELRNAQVQNLSTAPSSPVLGQLYFDTDTNRLNTWNGSTWDEYGTGSGAGDVTGGSASTDGEVVLYNSTTGKIIKRSNGISGIAKLTSGVLSAASTATDYYAPGGTDVAVADGGTGASTLTGVLKGNGTSAITGAATLTDVAAPTADYSLGSHKLTSVTDGTAASDAATKGQLDALSQGIFYKAAVRVASTANVTIASALENGDTIDGITLATGDRVLLKDQTSHSEDGIYIASASGAASRATDADATAEVGAGATVFVDIGTANANTQWTQTATIATIGTTAQAWVKTFQAADITGQAVPKKFSTLFGDAAATSFAIAHNLGLAVPHACLVDVTLVSSGAVELCDVVKTDLNTVTVSGWTTAPASNAYRATIIG